MSRNYLKYYKKNYLKNEKSKIKIRLISLFITVMFITIFVVFYIFLKIENSNIEYINESSMAINQAVSVKRKKLRSDFTAWNKTCEWNLIVVNNLNEIPTYFEPKLKKHGEVEVDERILASLNEMVKDANVSNAKIWVSSGYRSEERQKALFNREFDENIDLGLSKQEAFNLALKKISLPKHNEHNAGLAVDFNNLDEDFCITKEYEWLLENSVNYGFVLRYPKEKEDITGRAFEPAHFRYVGEENAKIMKEKNLCLEEYVSMLIK